MHCSLPGGASSDRPQPASRARCARFRKCAPPTSSFSGSSPCWSWSRLVFPTSCHFSTNQEFIMKKLFASLALAAFVAPVFAATQTVTLSVPGMTCASCPITVKHALSKVEGVSKTDVSFDKRQAVVTFDDAKTNVQKLTKATEDAGYPSSLKR
ncbi:Mercuric transport protein periplasmic component [Vreelandella titanicae BH1]|uniref:Periplasmic mercury ion-binding protein n=1 Tax=Vreelandella titanicae BH1 TaxID=1204738 RepID=L9U6K0_9GAMM|nr:Mercuric transport protein periplasmic component [Halomonas titanicae BH1]